MDAIQEQTFVERIGSNIAELRLEAELTQMALAKAIGVSQSMVSKIETGRLTPDLVTWIRICEVFDLDFQFPDWDN
jgi:DNA-binding XRE family transcriptional regulator